MGRYPVPSLEELSEDMQARIISVDEKLGLCPASSGPSRIGPTSSGHCSLGRSDAQGEWGYQGRAGDDRRRDQRAQRLASLLAQHGAILRLRTGDSNIADKIAANHRRAGLAPRQWAMLDFAVKVVTESHITDQTDFDHLHEHGLSDEDIWDIGAITAFFSYGSRMASLIDMRPNEEFYMVGRTRT